MASAGTCSSCSARTRAARFGQDEGGEPADLLFRDPHLIGSVLLFIAAAIMAVSRVRIPFLE